MPHPLPDIRICGTGPAALEAKNVLAELGVTVQAFLSLPWEYLPAKTLEQTPVLAMESVAGNVAPPVLLATDKPRKALKLLKGLAPELPVLHSFSQLLELMQEGLASLHPELFPPRPDPDNRRMFDYDRGLLPNKLLALYEKGVRNVQEAFFASGLSIGYPGWNLLYYACLCSLRPRAWNVILETGANVGCSSIILAQALKDSGYQGQVISVDIDRDVLAAAQKNLELAGVADLVQLRHGDSVAFLREGDGFGGLQGGNAHSAVPFAFLDGNHEAGHVFREFEALHPWLDAHSVVFFDNVDDPEGVAGALEMIRRHYGGNIVRFENTSWHPPGQALWQADGLKGVGP